MADREKVLKGLECCIYGYGCDSCESCPYYGRYAGHCVSKGLMPDVLELLKEQPEIIHCKNCKSWIPGKIDLDNFEAPRCKRNVGIWAGDDFCSHAERR